MTNDDETARRSRAERLREQIQQLKDDAADEATSADDATPGAAPRERRPETPRDFIHRKMHELDEGNHGG